MKAIKNIIKLFIPKIIKSKYLKYKRLKALKPYVGNNVLCPLCDSKYKMFAPFGLNNRDNARCMNCGSLERHRLLWLYLNDKTDLFSGKPVKLLHFAPERKLYNVFSENPNIDYFPCDLNPEEYNYEGTTKVIKADITDIPFNSESFDVILCNHVLEHIPNDNKAMVELERVLKNDGWGILQVPIDYNREKTFEDSSITTPKEKEEAYGHFDHERWYGKDYKNKLINVGFTVHEHDYVGELGPIDMKKYGLMQDEFVYYCTKQPEK